MIRMIVIPLLLLFVANIAFADRPPPPLTPSESLSGRPLLFEKAIATNQIAPPDMKLRENERITHIIELNAEAVDLVQEQIKVLIDQTRQSRFLGFATFNENHPILDVDLDIPSVGIFSDIKIKSVSRYKYLDKTKFMYHAIVTLSNTGYEASLTVHDGKLVFGFDGPNFLYQLFNYKGQYFFTQKPNTPFNHSPYDVVPPDLDDIN